MHNFDLMIYWSAHGFWSKMVQVLQQASPDTVLTVCWKNQTLADWTAGDELQAELP